MKFFLLLCLILTSKSFAQNFPAAGWMGSDPKSYTSGNSLYFSCDRITKTRELICDMVDVMIKRKDDICLFSFRKSTKLRFQMIADNTWGMPVQEGLCANYTMMMEYSSDKNPVWRFTSEVKLSATLKKKNPFYCNDFSKTDLSEYYSTSISPERNDCKRIKMTDTFLDPDMKVGKERFQTGSF